MSSPPLKGGILLALCLLSGCQNADLRATQSEERAYAAENGPEQAETPYVLLVSIDGYRYDYNDLYQPANLTAFAARGVQARSLIPGFPSDTFPNHYSIVTGMFPGTHGIVANAFLDRGRDASYQMGNADTVTDGSWYGGVPIWSAAEQAGIVTASFFWVGSEAEIAGERPSYYEAYDSSVSHEQRIAQVLEWLSYPEAFRPHFITLYFSSVDTAGHDWGPDSEAVREAVLELDADLGSLFAGLEEVDPPVNTFIVSDHGMVAGEPDKVIRIDDHADLSGMRTANLGSKIFLYGGDPDRTAEVYAELSDAAQHYRVFMAGETPEAWHAGNPRFGDIIVAADAPYRLVRGNTNPGFPSGAHGYDPYLYVEARGVFYAHGPDLVSSTTIPSFSNVHVYPLIVNLLGIEASDGIDGRPEVLAEIVSTR